MKRTLRALAATAAVAGTLAGCQKEEPPAEPPAGPRLEGAAAGLAIRELPAVFEVAQNDAEGFALHTVGAEGRLDFLPGEIENSINLVAAAREHEASFEDRPEGELKQRNEMMSTDFGTTYLSRGRYRNEAGVLEEEAALLLIHPWGDRMLTVRYVYPVGEEEEVRARLEEHLFVVFGELEGLPVPGAPGAAE